MNQGEVLDKLHKSDRRYKLALIFIFILILMTTVFTVAKVITVSNQVKSQSQFIINYLYCIGNIPPQQRGAAATNKCFDDYVPKDLRP